MSPPSASGASEITTRDSDGIALCSPSKAGNSARETNSALARESRSM